MAKSDEMQAQKKPFAMKGLVQHIKFLNDLSKQLSNFGQKKATPSAHPRHTLNLLPLLPSGPGGIRSTMLRGYQWSHQKRLYKNFLVLQPLS